MKVAQKNVTNPNTRSVYLSDASNYLNMAHFPFGHLSDTRSGTGKTFPVVSPFTYIAYYCVRAPLALHVDLSCILFALYLLFLPLFSSVDLEIADDALVIVYVTDDPSSLTAELPGKPPPP